MGGREDSPPKSGSEALKNLSRPFRPRLPQHGALFIYTCLGRGLDMNTSIDKTGYHSLSHIGVCAPPLSTQTSPCPSPVSQSYPDPLCNVIVCTHASVFWLSASRPASPCPLLLIWIKAPLKHPSPLSSLFSPLLNHVCVSGCVVRVPVASCGRARPAGP